MTAARRRLLVGSLVVATVALAVWGATTVLGNERRDAAVQRLLAQVDAAPHGATIDLRTAFDVEWDRAVVVGPYSPGSVVNEGLGFDHYAADDVITQGDGAYLLVFVRNRSVVAEVPLYGQAFYFGESLESFSADGSRFRVTRDDGGVLLTLVD
jgi:hypothetical protein